MAHLSRSITSTYSLRYDEDDVHSSGLISDCIQENVWFLHVRLFEGDVHRGTLWNFEKLLLISLPIYGGLLLDIPTLL